MTGKSASKAPTPCGPDEVRMEDGTIRLMTETELLMHRIDDATAESLESTRRMLAMCEENYSITQLIFSVKAKEAGISTLVMLDDQGEQLDRINEGMDQINEDMKDAEKNLDDLNKCCGLCVLPWNKRKGKGDFTKQLKDEDGFGGGDGPRIIVDQNGMGPTGGYITRINNDAREDEMDQNMQEVTGMIGNLRNMAIDMGSEISQQNAQIDRIHLKVTYLVVSVQFSRTCSAHVLRLMSLFTSIKL
ncbi:unnamed protein product [Schistocephalus solidus]|uniref:Synaptosomal-associated protein n=2 Tax=Schistocephalus solidus TaxID=70667 RepID=A0A183SGC9_SCHSO|nr:unnamed protein product [Schistocephalus solidus]